jgi:hypothetical protein
MKHLEPCQLPLAKLTISKSRTKMQTTTQSLLHHLQTSKTNKHQKLFIHWKFFYGMISRSLTTIIYKKCQKFLHVIISKHLQNLFARSWHNLNFFQPNSNPWTTSNKKNCPVLGLHPHHLVGTWNLGYIFLY